MKKKNNNILRIVVVTFLMISMLMWLAPISFGSEGGVSNIIRAANAQENDIEIDVNVDADIEIEEQEDAPKILPTNPIYFFKEWGRGLRQFFIFNKVNKADYELKVAETKLAELKAMAETDSENDEALKKAIGSYENTVERLKERIERISEKDTERVERFLDKLTEKSFNAQVSLERLKNISEETRENVEGAQDKVDEVIIQIPEKFNNLERFREGVIKAVENSNAGEAELEKVGILFRLENAEASNEVMKNLDLVKEDLLLRFEGRVNSGEITAKEMSDRINNLNINEALKIKIIDRLRENAENPELRSTLNEIRPKIISQFDFRDDSTREDHAERTIIYAGELVERLGFMINSGEFNVGAAVREHLQKAEFALSDAKALFDNGEFGAAFGQANSAAVVAYAGISSLQMNADNASINLENFKLRFDRLISVANKLELNREDHPELFELFNNAEHLIISATDAEDSESIRRILAEIEVVINKLRNTSRGESGDRKPVFCTEEYAPVCGVDGETYPNACYAKRAGAEIEHEGQCDVGEDASALSVPITLETRESSLSVSCSKGYQPMCVEKDENVCRKWECRSILDKTETCVIEYNPRTGEQIKRCHDSNAKSSSSATSSCRIERDPETGEEIKACETKGNKGRSE